MLAEFIAADVPFLPLERADRLAALQELMPRADVSMAEKYRRILEAYQIESDYGYTLEAWRGELGEGSEQRSVEFLRLGRVMLLPNTQWSRKPVIGMRKRKAGKYSIALCVALCKKPLPLPVRQNQLTG